MLPVLSSPKDISRQKNEHTEGVIRERGNDKRMIPDTMPKSKDAHKCEEVDEGQILSVIVSV